MGLTKFVSKYSAEEIEAMLDKVKLDMQVINFTQQEIAGLLTKIQGIKSSDLTNDLGFITNAVNDLANYYTKSQTYTKTEVNSLVNNITAASFELVNTLPTQDISTTAIYLVPNSSGQTNNTYDEYINLDGTSNGWEIIGSTQIDLSALNNKYDTSDQAETDLADADYVPFYDTSATSKRKTLWSNIKDKLKTYFDTMYHKKITVDTLADLVDSSNYQSTYLGMTVFVTSELKKYVLIGSDVTVASNWQPQGSGTADSPIIMTRSAYLQLSTAQKNDNKVRYIPDWPSSGGSSGGGTTILTETLLAAGWSNNVQTVNITGITSDADGVIGIADDTKLEDAQGAQIKITAVSDGSITFSCESTPSVDIPFVIMLSGGSGSGSSSSSKPIIYSTNETLIGKWLGENLYQKTINTGALPNSTLKEVAHGISNLGKVIDIRGYAYKSQDGTNITRPLPSSASSDPKCIDLLCVGNNIRIITEFDLSSFTESYVTLQYTKTS